MNLPSNLFPGASASLDEAGWGGEFTNDRSVPPPSNTPTNEDDRAPQPPAASSAPHEDGDGRPTTSSSSGGGFGFDAPGFSLKFNPTSAAAGSGGAYYLGAAGGSGSRNDSLWTLTDQPGIDLFLAGPRTWNRIPQVPKTPPLLSPLLLLLPLLPHMLAGCPAGAEGLADALD